MPIWANMALALALQKGLQSTPGYTTPPNGDTLGYWQQRVAYTITATLDERAAKVSARGTLKYVNNSPDTLREMYVHQYLNAFRPASEWSRSDEREGRERFQRLQEPDYGYERFTAPVRVSGSAVSVDYPGAPDSTVAHFALPAPLAPRDSVLVSFEWDARPSTLPRRQGRRGRHWDLAQWYPKVAVYDRGGWQYNALRPAGELYGEFGTYDVTLVLAQDQVIGSTGVPVAGDPGWSTAIRSGQARAASNAYDAVPPAMETNIPPGYKAVRFLARDVHHFAWSASPDYRYEGGVYARPAPRVHWPTWDSVSVHVLYRQGDDSTWGGMKVVRRTMLALQWLEQIYGTYAYPQMTVLHRLDGGGTEFPMMQMNGSPSQGLILHEGGHVFTYGILANNEWRSGWMDEGLTSYQTDWAQGFTPQERRRAAIVDQPVPATGYRARGMRPAVPRFEATTLDQAETDLRGGAEPIGTVAHEFRDFGTYNDMIYTRAEVMYSQLRDALGDSLFADFLHDYYTRWALKHVDERAMRASAERVSGRSLGWFFEQWVHHTGVMDYAIVRVRGDRDSSGAWLTRATVMRRGEHRHPISVGVRTASGWTLGRMSNDSLEREVVQIATPDEPVEVRLDPFHLSWDWDRRNDVEQRFKPFNLNGARANFDWPFLDQADRDHDVVLFRPMAWYSERGGGTYGLRVRSSYLGWLDKTEFGAVIPTRLNGLAQHERLQLWTRLENPYLGRRPGIGWRAGYGMLDDLVKADIGWRREFSRALYSLSHQVALNATWVKEGPLMPEQWGRMNTVDLTVGTRWTVGRSRGSYLFAKPRVIGGVSHGGYGKFELAAGGMSVFSEASRLGLRAYGGLTLGTVPLQRALFLSADDPVGTFYNHWWRPAGGILKRPGVNWLPLGGAGLRGYHWSVLSTGVVGANIDASRRVLQSSRASNALGVWLHVFGDAALQPEALYDAGVGVSLRGRIYDREILVRVDSPFYVTSPGLAIDRGRAGSGQLAPRWVITFNDLW